ncbi:RNA polymerase sigma factor [Planctomycetes bacterium Poly30]|uniref:RNA polymerase sigma factor n=1 Tax=Saltatorellus ferox TaxID=2528018 RepID=A0A518EPX0_9BACT|nr:RNA polymerase sigma factor [Planctomycetes bacterium Poly30]
MSPSHDSIEPESTWTPEQLLAHAGWMRALAAGLLSSQDRGEDLVQDALVGAIERPPRHEGHGGQVRAWLRKAVVHRARDLVRSETSRRWREHRAFRGGSAPSALELAASAELHRRLVEAVLRLEEPYRSTVLLRFYHGFEPRQIAAAADVPAATVRTRIRRGLERLRVALDSAYDGESQHWTAVALAGSGTVAVRSAALGLLPASLALVCALGLVLTATVLVLRRPVAGVERPGDGAVMAGADPAPAERSGLVPSPAHGSENREALVLVSDADPLPEGPVERAEGQGRTPRTVRSTRLTGQVRDAETGVPLAGVELRMGRRLSVVTDHAGHYVWEHAPADTPMDLRVFHPDYALGELRTLSLPFPSATRDIELEAGSPCRITCLDAFTREPVEGVVLEGILESKFGRTDREGVLSLRVRRGQELHVEFHHDDYARAKWYGTVKEVSAFEEVVIPLKRFTLIQGTARDRSGAALEDAHVMAYAPDEPRFLSALAVGLPGPWAFPGYLKHETPISDLARVDAGGSFTVPVVPSTHPFRVSVHRRTSNHEQETLIVRTGVVVESPEARTTLSLVLPDAGALEGRVTAADAPVRGADVLLQHASGWSHRARSDENGAYAVGHVPVGEIEMTVRDSSNAARVDRRKAFVRSAETSRVDTAWNEAVAAIRGVATRWDGTPAAGEPVLVVRYLGAQFGGTVKGSTDSEGRFLVEVPVQGRHVVQVGKRPSSVEVEVEVEPGGEPEVEPVEVVVPEAGWIAVRVEDALSGEPVEPSAFRHDSASWSSDACARSSLFGSGPVDPMRIDDGGEIEDGVAYFQVAGKTPASRITLELHLSELGYAPLVLRELSFVGDRSAATPVIARVSRGQSLAVKLQGEEPFTRERAEGVRFFFLERGDLNAVAGPLPVGSPECNIQLDGVPMRLDRMTLLQNQADLGTDGTALFQGLAPGQYSLRSFPARFRFEPEWIEVSEDGGTVFLTWSEP